MGPLRPWVSPSTFVELLEEVKPVGGVAESGTGPVPLVGDNKVKGL